MNCIQTSLFDIFKVGPGPSSSHTIGPMKAGCDFLSRLAALPADTLDRAHHLEAELFGSLALTGKGHGTDRAVGMGLLGEHPETCPVEELSEMFSDPDTVYTARFAGRTAAFSKKSIRFNTGKNHFPFSNTLVFRLFSEENEKLAEETYYSVGGGFIQREGDAPQEVNPVPYRYRNFDSFVRLTEKYSMSPRDVILANENALSGLSEAEIYAKLESLLNVMCEAVERGLKAEGVLPGPIRLQRRAATVYAKAMARIPEERFLVLLDAFSLAAAEENAAGHRVVTAPTSGSAGLMPGVLYFLRRVRGVETKKLLDGMLIAGLIAMIAKHNASISGAEVGCQGEIGVAAAMTAGLLAEVNGCSFAGVGCAAEIALEHHLGLSCDPVDGYVQIPCIERNAVGAVTAFNAALIASVSDPSRQKVSFDEVLEAMLQTGKCMSPAFKETSRGGLAACTLCG